MGNAVMSSVLQCELSPDVSAHDRLFLFVHALTSVTDRLSFFLQLMLERTVLCLMACLSSANSLPGALLVSEKVNVIKN